MSKAGGDMTYLEVVDNALAIEKVVCDGEEVPVQRLAPWVPAADVPLAIFPLQGEKGSNLPVHKGLTKHHKEDHVRMAHKQKS